MARSTERLDKLEALYRINESVLSILEINQLLDKVLNIMEGTFGSDGCGGRQSGGGNAVLRM